MRNPKFKSSFNHVSHKKKITFSRIRKLKRLSEFQNSISHIVCNENSKRNNIITIQSLMKKHKPFVLSLPTNEESSYPFFQSKNQQDLLEEISHLLSRKFPDKIDVNSSKNGVFSGNYHQQETISLNFRDFLDYNGESTLYLAQIPLYKRLKKSDFYASGSQKMTGLKGQLDFINKNQKTSLNFKIPHPLNTLLKNQELDSINLWLSRKTTISNWHYDSYDNFLCMISGTKEIRLLSPSLGNKILNRNSILEPFYNQANGKDGKRSKKEIKCHLNRNQILFIPQGWYHYVKSHNEDLMVGLSIWFN